MSKALDKLTEEIKEGLNYHVNKEHYISVLNDLIDVLNGEIEAVNKANTNKLIKAQKLNKSIALKLEKSEKVVKNLDKQICELVSHGAEEFNKSMQKLSDMETSRNAVRNQVMERDQLLISKEKQQVQFMKIIENLSSAVNSGSDY